MERTYKAGLWDIPSDVESHIRANPDLTEIDLTPLGPHIPSTLLAYLSRSTSLQQLRLDSQVDHPILRFLEERLMVIPAEWARRCSDLASWIRLVRVRFSQADTIDFGNHAPPGTGDLSPRAVAAALKHIPAQRITTIRIGRTGLWVWNDLVHDLTHPQPLQTILLDRLREINLDDWPVPTGQIDLLLERLPNLETLIARKPLGSFPRYHALAVALAKRPHIHFHPPKFLLTHHTPRAIRQLLLRAKVKLDMRCVSRVKLHERITVCRDVLKFGTSLRSIRLWRPRSDDEAAVLRKLVRRRPNLKLAHRYAGHQIVKYQKSSHRHQLGLETITRFHLRASDYDDPAGILEVLQEAPRLTQMVVTLTPEHLNLEQRLIALRKRPSIALRVILHDFSSNEAQRLLVAVRPQVLRLTGETALWATKNAHLIAWIKERYGREDGQPWSPDPQLFFFEGKEVNLCCIESDRQTKERE